MSRYFKHSSELGVAGDEIWNNLLDGDYVMKIALANAALPVASWPKSFQFNGGSYHVDEEGNIYESEATRRGRT